MNRDEQQPLVVIGMPTYNRAARLERALRSALDQDYENLRIVVSDNASTDGTRELCRAIAASDQRLLYHRQPENVGSLSNFEWTLANAKGEFFMWLADDDWIDPTFVRHCVARLQASRDAVLVGGRGTYYRNSEPVGRGLPVNCTSRFAALRVLRYIDQVDDNAIYYGVMRLDAARRIRFPKCVGSDWMFVAALACQGNVETLDGVFVHRALGGASEDRARMIRALRLPRWQAHVPLTFSIAAHLMGDIWRNPPYLRLGTVRRAALALGAASWVCAVKPFQVAAKLLRQRSS